MSIELVLRKNQNSPLTAEQADKNIETLGQAVESLTEKLSEISTAQEAFKTALSNAGSTGAMSSSSGMDESSLQKIAGVVNKYDISNLPYGLSQDCLAIAISGENTHLVRFDSSKGKWLHIDGAVIS